jgi:putative peptide zinc metalloprotease protein
MGPDFDHGILEATRTRLKLRDDLVFTPQLDDAKPGCVVEDPVKSKYYRVGLAEYTFLSMFDGGTTVEEALALTARALPESSLSAQDATALCRWLVETELAHTEASTCPERVAESAARVRSQNRFERLNPVMFRFSLGSPDRLVEKILPWIGWLYTAPMMVMWAGCVGFGAYQIAVHWDRFVLASEGVFSPGRWVWLALGWLVLKVLHELSHAAACKRYGGPVRDAGVLLILFAPIAYVDVTSSWRFRSKWHRIATAAAGIYAELWVAALAAVAWSRTDTGAINDLCFHLIVMASLTTLVFNANFLMRFDGYYIVADLLGIPNLYPLGQQYPRYLARRYLMGVSVASPAWPEGKGVVVRVYGLAALVWRVVVYAGLLIGATALFHGAGVVLALAVGVLWIGLPAIHGVKYLLVGKGAERPNRLRFALLVGMIFGAVALVLALPWPGAYTAPALVEFSPPVVVRTKSPGFVKEIRVREGQVVEPGQVIVVLANEQLNQELTDVELAIEQSRLRARIAHQRDEMASYQAEQKKVEGLDKQRREKLAEVEQLTIRAPSGGQVVARNLSSLQGTHLKVGTEVVSIGNEIEKEFRVSIRQDDVARVLKHLQGEVHVRVPGGGQMRCKLTKVTPRASREPLHLALCAPFGGSLTVRKRTDEERTGQEASEDYELLTPHFTATLSLSADQGRQLRAGQRGTVAFDARGEAVGSHLLEMLTRYLRNALKRVMSERPLPP